MPVGRRSRGVRRSAGPVVHRALVPGLAHRVVPAVIGCALLAVLIPQLSGPEDGLSYRIAFQLVALLGVGWAGYGAWLRRQRLGLVGGLLVAAVSCQYIGDTGWTLNLLVLHKEPWPSWTDAFFLLSYVFMMAATVAMLRRREAHGDITPAIDATIISVGVAVVMYAFVIVDAASQTEAGLLGRVVGVIYPVCDVLLVGALVRMTIGSAAREWPTRLLAGAMVALLAGDIAFLVAVFAGKADSDGRWIDAAYLLFYLLIGLALVHPDAGRLLDHNKPQRARLSPLRLASLAVGSLLAPLTLLAGSVAGDVVKVRGAAIGAALLFLLVVGRMVQLIRTIETNSDLFEMQARTDGLTGLANRRTFDFELDRMTHAEWAQHRVPPFSIAMLDLDHFKAFNDSQGHAAGDTLLRQASENWSAALKSLAPAAVLARYGGEEFAVLMPGVDEQSAASLIRDLLPLTPQGQSFSAGVAQWNHAEEPVSTLARADQRMYQAKGAGRARVVDGAEPDAAVLATQAGARIEES